MCFTVSSGLPLLCAAAAALAAGQERVSFLTPDGGLIEGLSFGKGSRGVVLTFDFRGFGKSTGPGQRDIFTAPLYQDVLGAVRYLRARAQRRFRWWAQAWEDGPQPMLQFMASKQKSIASSFWGPEPETVRPRRSRGASW